MRTDVERDRSTQTATKRLRIAAFVSHPIQYLSPLWRELSGRPDVELKVFYFSRQALESTVDRGFGVPVAWNVDLLGGHDYEFLPRQWPTRDPRDSSARALNSGLFKALDQGWDAIYVSGYARRNNWALAVGCRHRGIPLLCFADSNLSTERDKPPLKLGLKRLVLGLALPHVPVFLAAGGATREYLLHYGARPDSIFPFPLAVDVERFRRSVEQAGEERARLRERLGIAPDKRVVMFCGKLVARKRPQDVLEAVQRLGRSDVQAVFVGEGELRPQLQAAGAVLSGFVNQAEIPLALSLADVLVMSSEFEPYGMVVAEAQVLGVPAIVSHTCGCHGRDAVLQDGVSGFVYSTGDVAQLAAHLDRLLADPQLLQRMREAARLRGETHTPASSAGCFLTAVSWAIRNTPRA